MNKIYYTQKIEGGFIVIKDEIDSKKKIKYIYKVQNIYSGKKTSREIYKEMIKNIIKDKEVSINKVHEG